MSRFKSTISAGFKFSAYLGSLLGPYSDYAFLIPEKSYKSNLYAGMHGVMTCCLPFSRSWVVMHSLALTSDDFEALSSVVPTYVVSEDDFWNLARADFDDVIDIEGLTNNFSDDLKVGGF